MSHHGTLIVDSRRAHEDSRKEYTFKTLWVQNRFRQKLQRFFMMSAASYYMDLVNAALSMMTCGIFVLMTYIHPESKVALWAKTMETIFSVYFIFDYVLRLVLADFPLQKVREMMMIIDFCTTVPVFIDFLGDGSTPPTLTLTLTLTLNLTLTLTLAPQTPSLPETLYPP